VAVFGVEKFREPHVFFDDDVTREDTDDRE